MQSELPTVDSGWDAARVEGRPRKGELFLKKTWRLSQLLIKAADLSNTFKCFESSRMWSILSITERLEQVHS